MHVTMRQFYELQQRDVFRLNLCNSVADFIKKHAHYFTHKQLEIILEHFCITPEEFEQL